MTGQAVSMALGFAVFAYLARVLEPGSPLWLALWGGAERLHFDEAIEGQRRPFHGRPVQRNAELLGAVFTIEDIDLWHVGGGEYQVFRLRAPDRARR